MRDKLRALYYPEFFFDYATLIKSILLFDEIHLMDRPSLTFDGKHLTVGARSPIRAHEQWFREQGVPLYVHEPPSGLVAGELLQVTEADIATPNFVSRFQGGLKSSKPFRDLHIQPGNYGNGETNETIVERLVTIELASVPSLLDVHRNSELRPYNFADPESSLKTLVSMAAFCSAKMNFALKISATEGFSPLADMSPYASLLGSKYKQVATIPTTDVSLAILEELLPPERIAQMTVEDAIKYRKESESARDAFLEYLMTLQAKLNHVPENSDFGAEIDRLVTTEIRPAARVFRNKLDSIYEGLVGKVVSGAVVWAGSSAALQFFGDISWHGLLGTTAAAGAYLIPRVVDSLAAVRAVRRECAVSYLLDLEK
jgi:hypothetical protein